MEIQGKEIVAATGKYVARKGTDIYFIRGTILHGETLENFIEVDTIPDLDEELTTAKQQKIDKITTYDTSSAVNNFKYNGQDMWLTREDRLALTDRFSRELERGISVTNLYYNGQAIMVTPQQGLDLVAAVATYADACFDNTQKNIGTVYLAQSKEEVEAIDITQGYPEQLNLSAL